MSGAASALSAAAAPSSSAARTEGAESKATPAFATTDASLSEAAAAAELAKVAGADHQVCVLLDASGSMLEQRIVTVEATNACMDTFRAGHDAAEKVAAIGSGSAPCVRVSMSMFSGESATEAREVWKKVPISDVPRLKASDYTPSGGTPLFDVLYESLAAWEEFPNLHMVVITDGQDTSSATKFDNRDPAVKKRSISQRMSEFEEAHSKRHGKFAILERDCYGIGMAADSLHMKNMEKLGFKIRPVERAHFAAVFSGSGESSASGAMMAGRSRWHAQQEAASVSASSS